MDAGLEAKHAQGLLEGTAQSGRAEVIGAHEAVALAAEHPDAGTHPEGWGDAGDHILLRQHPQVISALEEHLHQISSGPAPTGQQILQSAGPAMVEAAGVRRGGGDHAMAGGRGEAR